MIEHLVMSTRLGGIVVECVGDETSNGFASCEAARDEIARAEVARRWAALDMVKKTREQITRPKWAAK